MQVANCRSCIDPSAGDQSGNEWRTQPWFSYDWDCVLRYPDKTVASYIDSYAIHAANNDYCGYSQSNRLSFWNALTTVKDYDPQYIQTYCDADCSSSSAAIVKAVGYHLNIPQLMNVSEGLTTFYMESALIGAGFQSLKGSSYTAMPNMLEPGDILLNTQAHACIVVSDSDPKPTGGYSGGTVSTTTTVITQQPAQVNVVKMVTNLPLLKQGTVGNSEREDTRACQALLNLRGSDLKEDGIYGSATTKAVTEFQKSHNLLADGECGSSTWNALITMK